MADFDFIHRKCFVGAQQLRPGHIWTIALHEPIGSVEAAGPLGEVAPEALFPKITMVRFVMCNDRLLRPVDVEDRAAIHDWKIRHQHTPDADFGLPQCFGECG